MGTRSPALLKASDIDTDCPPEPPVSPMPSPVNGANVVSALSMSTVSSIESARMAPACLITTSQVSMDSAIAPVCDDVARLPSAVCPPFQMTTGLTWQVSFSSRKKRRPSRTLSTYMAMKPVASSCPKYSR